MFPDLCAQGKQEAETWFDDSMVLKAAHVPQCHRGESQRISAMAYSNPQLTITAGDLQRVPHFLYQEPTYTTYTKIILKTVHVFQ